MSDSAFTLLEVGLDPNTGKTFVIDVLPQEENEQAYEFAAAYLDTASAMLESAHKHIHMAFDPKLAMAQGRGHSHRFATVAGTNEKLMQAIAEARGQKVTSHDLIVIFGPQALSYRSKPEVMERVVAGDLSVFFDVVYPIECSGPIEGYMPSLTQVAARILLPGNPEVQNRIGGTGKKSVINVLADRQEYAIDIVIREVAERDYGGDGAVGLLLTDKPYLPRLAEEVAKEARQQLEDAVSPMPFDMMVMFVHNTIAQAMRNIDMQVSNRVPVSRLPSSAVG